MLAIIKLGLIKL